MIYTCIAKCIFVVDFFRFLQGLLLTEYSSDDFILSHKFLDIVANYNVSKQLINVWYVIVLYYFTFLVHFEHSVFSLISLLF